MIPFNNRFHGHNSLRYVYKNGKTARSRLFVVKITANKYRKKSRFAVVISKKVLKSAVRRNRVRRRVYEYIRNTMTDLNDIYDIVVIVSSGEALSVSYDDMINQLSSLFNQVEAIKPAANISKNTQN